MTIYTPVNPIHTESDWFTAQVNYTFNGRARAKIQTIDNRDREHPIQMVDDPVSTIALKCFLILIGLPFYTLGVMATHTVRCFTLIGKNLSEGNFTEAFLSLIQEVWAVAKAPIYGLAIAFYAAVGILFPLPMRSVIAQLERDWSGSDRSHSLCVLKTENGIRDYFFDRKSKNTVFLAHCFQPIGELNNIAKVQSYTVEADQAE